MKTVFDTFDRQFLGKIESLAEKLAAISMRFGFTIVNKFFQELKAGQARAGLRLLTRRQLDDIGLTPFDRDQLLN
jgi:uncharacterized protein YjiS (DUF1127 family)